MSEKSNVMKIVIIGDPGVGKSNIISQFSRGEFKLGEKPTIGVEFVKRKLEIEGKEIELQVWDTAGQEKFGKVSSPFYRAAVGAIIVFDLTRPETLDHFHKWKRELYESADDSISLIIMGNKCDLKNLRSVRKDDIDYIIEEGEGLKYSEVSALTGEGIEAGFKLLVKDIMSNLGQKFLDNLETNSSNSESGFRVSLKNKPSTGKCTC